MDMPDMPVNVPIDNPNADTEWNDILRSKGIIPEKPPDPEPIIQTALLEAHQRAHDNRLEDRTLPELDDLEDLEDDAFLNIYRQKRLAELSTLQKASLHGQVYALSKPSYARDVTEASTKFPVLVNLTSASGNTESRLLSALWHQLAVKYADVKFCEMRGELAIEGYPERNCPTILAYRNGDIVRQIVTLSELGGLGMKSKDLEELLVSVGAVAEGDVRLKEKGDEDEDDEGQGRRGVKGKKAVAEDDDDDWD